MKILKYAFLTGTIAYFIAAVVIFILSVSQTGWSRIETGETIVSALTLGLSEFGWWGNFYYLAVLVPWLGSTLLLALLLFWLDGGEGRRRLFGGLSIFAYYLAMWLAFVFHMIIFGRGDVAYPLLLIWPVAGFLLGYLSAIITDKMIESPVRD